MIRLSFFTLLGLGLASLAASAADVVVAPPPREKGQEFVPDTTKSQNPQETVERIIKNSKAVGDKLAMTDTGQETQKTQDTILKDIQSLIDQQENPPPPPKPDQNPDMDKDNKDQKQDKQPKDKDNQPNHPNGKGDQPSPMPMGNMGDMQPMGGSQSPMGGSGDSPQRRPRQGGGQAKSPGKTPGNAQAGGGNSSRGGTSQNASNTKPQQPGGGGTPPPNNGKPPTSATLPPEEAPVKDVWGYLPDKLRQQAMQYYKQEFMPRYAKLLEHYYSSLAEKGGKK